MEGQDSADRGAARNPGAYKVNVDNVWKLHSGEVSQFAMRVRVSVGLEKYYLNMLHLGCR